MPTKIRLSRHGKTHRAFYHIVVADGRAPRDGRFIEKIGTYNPISNPAEIELNFDKALDWIMKGAQPTDTARAILSLKGVMHKSHLLKGVIKGALTEAEAEAKFQKWLDEKEAKLASAQSGIDEKVRAEKKALHDAEVKVNEDRAAELAKRKAAVIEAQVKAAKEAAAEKETEEETTEAVVEEQPVAEVKEEEPVAEVKEEPKAEVKEEPKTEVKEEPKAEVKEEKPEPEVKEEPKAEAADTEEKEEKTEK